MHKIFSSEVTKTYMQLKGRKDWLIRTGKVTGFSEIQLELRQNGLTF